MTDREEPRAPEGEPGGDPAGEGVPGGGESVEEPGRDAEGGGTVFCRRLGREGTRMDKPPFRSELGRRIQESISVEGWEDWLRYQTAIINHYGLDPRDPEARKFLYRQVEEVLLGGESEEEIDTSLEGEVEW